jgi:hypothetical protein
MNKETEYIKAKDLIRPRKRYRIVKGDCDYRNPHIGHNGKVHFGYWSEETNENGLMELDPEELVEVYEAPEAEDCTPPSLKAAFKQLSGELSEAIRNG